MENCSSRDIEVLPFVTMTPSAVIAEDWRENDSIEVESSITRKAYTIVVREVKSGAIEGTISMVGTVRISKSEWRNVLLKPSENGRRLVVSALT